MTEPESRFFQSAGLRLHYVVWGDESKPPLLLVHGGRDHARMWDFVAGALVDCFSIYAPDLRGHGDSDWVVGGTYRLSDYVVDLVNLVEVLERGPVTLIGHSLGGRLVLDLAGTFPEKVSKLVSIEGFVRAPPDMAAPGQLRRYMEQVRELEQRKPHAYSTLAEAEGRMQEANKRLSQDLVQHLTRHAVRRRDDGAYVWKFDNRMHARGVPEWSDEDTKAIWQGIEAPTLLVGGGEGWVRQARSDFVRSALAEARFEMIDDAGHWVHHDQFDRFVAVARDFLA